MLTLLFNPIFIRYIIYTYVHILIIYYLFIIYFKSTLRQSATPKRFFPAPKTINQWYWRKSLKYERAQESLTS